MDDKKYQTRSEETGLNFFDSLSEALDYAESDLTVWKISYTEKGTDNRIRLLKGNDGIWTNVPICPKKPKTIEEVIEVLEKAITEGRKHPLTNIKSISAYQELYLFITGNYFPFPK